MIKGNKINKLAWVINLIIIILSLAPIGDQIPQPLTRSDLMYHSLAYAGTCFLFLISTKGKVTRPMLLLSIQGVVIEFIQPYFMRHFEYLDIVANTFGVIFGFIVFYISSVLFSRRSTGPFKKTSE